MDLGVLGGIQLADWIILIYFLAFFVLGFAQGTIRRLIGIASILFSFLFAANVAGPLGDFLKANWTDQNPQYSFMVGFLTIFVAAALAFAIVVQGFYRPQPLFEKARFYPFWPIEAEGDFVTHAQVMEEYQRFLKA